MYEIDFTDLPELVNDCYWPLLNDKSRYLILKGGGGSGKSVFATQKIIYRMLTEQPHRILVVRKVKSDLRDSCFQELKNTIDRWGLTQIFKMPTGRSSELYIRCINGNECIFYGLDDVEKRKSISGITSMWIEEATELDIEDYRQLDIRLRGQTKTYKQMILSFNPISITHWLKAEFFDREVDNAKVSQTTYKDNKFLDTDAIKVLEDFKDKDPYYYAVYCLGQWGVIGKIVFDAEKLTLRRAEISNKQPKHGRIENGKFIEDVNGDWTIYKKPTADGYYVIGADVAEGLENGDYSAAHVMDNNTMEEVATYHGHCDPDQYAEILYNAGIYYNQALIGVEINMEGGVVRNLERLHYPKLYMRETQDNITHEVQKKFGWRTTEQSRRLIVSNLIEYVRDYPHLINDIPTIDEMLVFVRSEKGKPQAQDGKHDDLVMSYAITLEMAMCGQQTRGMRQGEVDYNKLSNMPEDVQEDYYNASPEQKIYIAKKLGLLK